MLLSQQVVVAMTALAAVVASRCVAGRLGARALPPTHHPQAPTPNRQYRRRRRRRGRKGGASGAGDAATAPAPPPGDPFEGCTWRVLQPPPPKAAPGADVVAGETLPPVGLRNPVGANLCFFNAVLQSLAALPPVVDWVRVLEGQAGAGGPSASSAAAVGAGTPFSTFLAETAALLAALQAGAPLGARPLTAAPLLAAARSASPALAAALAPGRQHDADEAVNLLVDALVTAGEAACGGGGRPTSAGLADASLSRAGAAGPPAPRPRCPLVGTLLHESVCATCGCGAPRHVCPFVSLPLALAACGGTLAPGASVAGALRALVGVEPVAGVECASCSLRASLCAAAPRAHAAAARLAAAASPRAPLHADVGDDAGVGVRWTPTKSALALRRCVVARAPPALCLHLRRAVAAPGGGTVKLTGAVPFDDALDLGPLTAAGAPPVRADVAPNHRPLRHPPLYALAAVVAHVGRRAGGGHYVAYARRPAEGGGGGWHGTSDARVWAAEWGEVAAAEASLLLYVREPS